MMGMEPNHTEQTDAATRPASRDDAEGRDFAIAAARIAQENKSEDVRVLDLRGLSSVTDFFVIGTGTSDRQMGAVLDQIADFGRERDRRPFNKPNRRDGAWMIADYVDVVIHLFDEDHRDYYDLEGLWGDAPEVAWQPEDNDTPADTDN